LPNTFDSLGFASRYRCTVDPEFPGTGSWGRPTFEFPRKDAPGQPFRSPWGAPLVIRVEPDQGEEWVGFFRAGGIGGLTGAFGCPSPNQVCVSTAGQAYLVNVENPSDYQPLSLTPVLKIHRVAGADLVLITSFISMLALDPDGPLWETDRLCLDDLDVVAASPTAIVCTGSWLGGPERFTVDPVSGSVISGCVFVRDFPQFAAKGGRWRRNTD
jgi:hypothetical protein